MHNLGLSSIDISGIKVGLLNLFLKHTSASLTINENFSTDVRKDLENISSSLIPDGNFYEHNLEGEDDMSAHMKSSIFGVSLNIPITDGKLNLGTWQGIYLNEHKNYPSEREIVITILKGY
jgi:secondary thiamine-phosphate synthase enzyme